MADLDTAPVRKQKHAHKKKTKGGKRKGTAKIQSKPPDHSRSDLNSDSSDAGEEEVQVHRTERQNLSDEEENLDTTNLDLDELIQEVVTNDWYRDSSHIAVPTNEWPHVKDSPLGFELEAHEIDLPKDIFELDLNKIDYALSHLPAHQLMRGLDQNIISEQELLAGAPKRNFFRKLEVDTKIEQPERLESSATQSRRPNKDSYEEDHDVDDDLDELLEMSREKLSQTKISHADTTEVEAEKQKGQEYDEDQELDALLGL